MPILQNRSRKVEIPNVTVHKHSLNCTEVLSSTGTQSSFTLRASFCIKVKSEQTVTQLSVYITCNRRAEYTVGGRPGGTFGDITQPTCLAGSIGTPVVKLRSPANTNFSQLEVKWWLFGGEYCLT
jgi:hypothetical protein